MALSLYAADTANNHKIDRREFHDEKLVLAALLTSFAFGAAALEKISFGVSATYPPFESMDANNQIVGFDIDLAHALCKQMQAECTFTNHAFDSLIPALKFKKYDAVISGMDITPERSKQVAFTDPYYANSALVIAKKMRSILSMT